MLISSIIPTLGNGSGYAYITDSGSAVLYNLKNSANVHRQIVEKVLTGDRLGYRVFFNTAGVEGTVSGTEITKYIIPGYDDRSLAPDAVQHVTASNQVTYERVSRYQFLNITTFDTATPGVYDLQTLKSDPFSTGSDVFQAGDVLVLFSNKATYTITARVAEGGNIKLKGTETISLTAGQSITLYYDGTNWQELFRNETFDTVTKERGNGRGFPVFGIESFTIPAGGASSTVSPGVDGRYVQLTGSGTLTGSYSLAQAGTPIDGDEFIVEYRGNWDLNGFNITIFGYGLTASEAAGKKIDFHVRFRSGVFVVQKYYDFTGNGLVEESDIVDGSISPAKIKPLANPGNFLVADGSNDVQDVAMSGDATMDQTGAVTIEPDAVTNTKILDGSVSPDKLDSETKLEVITALVTFETGELGDHKIKIPYKSQLKEVNSYAVKAIAATDDGTITFTTSAGLASDLTTLFTASDPRGTEINKTTATQGGIDVNTFIVINTSKVTAGGKVLLTLKLERQE